ncbi:MAG TPA: class I SAM-dependent methyltransferase [Candidatus Binatia bacterium]|nr:class I SAM-dependent methyltransferase [Candidatus Binatia bacterium]
MQEGKPSRTAIVSAVMRAAHLALDGEPKILADHLARALSGITDDHPLADLDLLQRHEFRQLRALMVLRNRYVEDELALALTRGVTQYVILGAGLDSFAYRRPAQLRHLHIFEVDHPVTQRWKQSRLNAVGITVPDNVHFVPVNFESESFSDKIKTGAFNPSQPTFFSWLGVSQYLTREALEATLREVMLCVTASRQLVMDFVVPEATLGPTDRQQILEMRTRSGKLGEPWLSYYQPHELRQILKGTGFAHVLHFSPELAAERYFSGRADGLTHSGAYHLMNASGE